MAYYPKSQIQTNLYTNGNELVLQSDRSEYVGYYYKTSDGSYFSGKTPQDVPNYRLLLLSKLPENNVIGLSFDGQYINSSIESIEYPLFKTEKLLVPYYSPNIPTPGNYVLGEYNRYFCKKINEIIYIEINKDIYSKLKKGDPSIAYEYYQPFLISWQLTGNKEQVYKVNRNITLLAMKNQKLPQFDKYLKEDYTKYYK